ncbi:MAG TPA: hypothetical protein VM681_02425 [Candidatus Thermoplasmatota archaeon]|nr:hypothetical protein [Candidatus Thermoplasmatota archaeon]
MTATQVHVARLCAYYARYLAALATLDDMTHGPRGSTSAAAGVPKWLRARQASVAGDLCMLGDISERQAYRIIRHMEADGRLQRRGIGRDAEVIIRVDDPFDSAIASAFTDPLEDAQVQDRAFSAASVWMRARRQRIAGEGPSRGFGSRLLRCKLHAADEAILAIEAASRQHRRRESF